MTKFLHTCVRVKDLEASLQFYQEALGFKEVRRPLAELELLGTVFKVAIPPVLPPCPE